MHWIYGVIMFGIFEICIAFYWYSADHGHGDKAGGPLSMGDIEDVEGNLCIKWYVFRLLDLMAVFMEYVSH